jgi:hypothetical protein
MRLLASLQHYLVAAGPDGLWLSQYASGTFSADLAGQRAEVEVSTDYPWQGRISLRVTATGGQPWGLHLRVPGWCGGAEISVNGLPQPAEPDGGWLHIVRRWQPGDVAELDLPMPARLTTGHPRADAIRGCVAIERGPLVYCLEQADLPAAARLDDVAIDCGSPPLAHEQAGLLGGVVTVTAAGYLRQAEDGRGDAAWWPYQPAGKTDGDWAEITLTAIPYFAWANRGPGAMRVWTPRRPGW